MAEFVATSQVNWKVRREAGSDLYRLLGRNTLRDRPIDLVLTAAEILTLAEFLRYVAATDIEQQGNFDVTADR